jgi:hypothetical protein
MDICRKGITFKNIYKNLSYIYYFRCIFPRNLNNLLAFLKICLTFAKFFYENSFYLKHIDT